MREDVVMKKKWKNKVEKNSCKYIMTSSLFVGKAQETTWRRKTLAGFSS